MFLIYVQIMSFWQGVKFSVEFWMFVLYFFQPTLKSDLEEVQFTQNYLFCLRHPFNTLKVSKISEFGQGVEKHNSNKYSKFYANFVIWCPVKVTWSGHWSNLISDINCEIKAEHQIEILPNCTSVCTNISRIIVGIHKIMPFSKQQSTKDLLTKWTEHSIKLTKWHIEDPTWPHKGAVQYFSSKTSHSSPPH